ncbi:MAG: LCP family protein [Anaerolineales bacterium]|nr:LCP family protein [Anaerolineales bacterium]
MSTHPKSQYLRNFILLLGASLLLCSLSGVLFFYLSGGESDQKLRGVIATLAPELAYADEIGDSENADDPATTDVANPESVAGDAQTQPLYPTDTPAQADSPTATPYPIIYNDEGLPMAVTWGDYPGPQYWHGTQIPPPMGMLPRADKQIVILLMGNDHTRKNKGARTDVNMLLILNPDSGTATVTSFPRDLYVYAPGHTMMRINSVQGLGGFELSALMYEYNFGIRPDYYVNINLENFVTVIDELGGIDVFVPEPVADPTFVNGKFSVPAGIVHMDGRTARFYVRSRTGTDDFERNARQQEVLKAIFLRLVSRYGFEKASTIYQIYSNSVLTNLELEHLVPLVPLAAQIQEDTNRVRRYAIGEDQTAPYTSPAGGQVMLVEREPTLVLLVQALSPWAIGE